MFEKKVLKRLDRMENKILRNISLASENFVLASQSNTCTILWASKLKS